MIQTESDLALKDTGMNFEKIPWFQEVTMWNTQEMSEDLVMHCTATPMVVCMFHTWSLIMAPDWTKQPQNMQDVEENFETTEIN